MSGVHVISTGRKLALIGLCLLLSGCGGVGGGEAEKPITAAAPCATSVIGKAINENPRTESADIAFSASLASLGTSVTVNGLDGSCLLRNSYFGVTHDSGYPGMTTHVRNTGLVFAGDDPRFRQVSTYFHAQSVRTMITGAGGDLSALSSLAFDAHCNVQDNAYYSPSGNLVCLGYSNVSAGKKIYASDDADVIMHEFGHAINHKVASTNIMNSSFESGALDESMADYWALTTIGNATLSEWFLGFFDFADATTPDPTYVRVATANHAYPADLEGQIHRDSRPWTQVMWTIRQAIGATKADALAIRMVDLLPATTRYSNAVAALQSAASSLGFTAGEITSINNALTAKGFIRTDSAAGLALSTVAGRKSVYIIDDHTKSYQVGGNCNAALDVGETALVMVNPQSPMAGAVLGAGVGTMTVTGGTGAVSFATGGSIGDYLRMNGTNQDFVDVLLGANIFSPDDSTINASFLIRGVTAGLVTFDFVFQPMGGAPVTLPVSLTVGSVATRATTCPSGATALRSLWPVP